VSPLFQPVETEIWQKPNADKPISRFDFLILLQGPVLRVPCRVVVLGPKGAHSVMLIACARGFGQSMSEAFLDAGTEWGLASRRAKRFLRLPERVRYVMILSSYCRCLRIVEDY